MNVDPEILYGVSLALLGTWGLFLTSRVFRITGIHSRLRQQILALDVFFTLSCYLASAGLLAGVFRTWMLLPLGASFLVMTRFPCYFNWADRVWWVHRARIVLFVLIAAACLGLGLNLIPPSTFGLRE